MKKKYINWASLVVQTVKNLPAMQDTRVRSLGWGDPLEKEMATHSSILAWKMPWTERSLAGYRLWGHKESDTTEQLTLWPSVHQSEYEIFSLVFLTEILLTILRNLILNMLCVFPQCKSCWITSLFLDDSDISVIICFSANRCWAFIAFILLYLFMILL